MSGVLALDHRSIPFEAAYQVLARERADVLEAPFPHLSDPVRIANQAATHGRQIELVVRDTQSDPTKAVNAVAELTQRQKVAIIFGPLNSGEALAATPLIARDKVPMIHPCWVDQLIDVKKYPMAFREAPTNQQIGGAANQYVVDVLKLKKVAVVSDTTGYGTASVDAYVPMLKARGSSTHSRAPTVFMRTR